MSHTLLASRIDRFGLQLDGDKIIVTSMCCGETMKYHSRHAGSTCNRCGITYPTLRGTGHPNRDKDEELWVAPVYILDRSRGRELENASLRWWLELWTGMDGIEVEVMW